jgi:predicted permease
VVITALAPIFALIGLGYLLYRYGFPSANFWPAAERLTYFVLFPALLFSTLATSPANPVTAAPMSLALFLAVCCAAAFALAMRGRIGEEGPAFTSVFQGSIRPNTYVGLAAAGGVWGEPGLAAAAVAVAVLVPTVNVLSVSTLARYGSMPSVDRRETWGKLARNPLILACLAGIGVKLTGIAVPDALIISFKAAGRASLPLGLLAVGAGLRFGDVAGHHRAVLAATAGKLVVFPLACALFLALFGVTGAQAGAALVFAAIPTSASSYVLAGQMGGDQGLMASIITVETLAAAATLPLVLAWV